MGWNLAKTSWRQSPLQDGSYARKSPTWGLGLAPNLALPSMSITKGTLFPRQCLTRMARNSAHQVLMAGFPFAWSKPWAERTKTAEINKYARIKRWRGPDPM